MSYTEFSVTFIHNKFGGVSSILVPSQRVVIDNNGLTTEDLFKTENQKFNFEIYGEEFMVSGEVCIPGEWNYACIGGKFFHLEKTASYGYVDGQLTFYYTLIYDDGQNDGLTNNVNLCGTINLTGDRELVKQNLVQTTPLISNVNNFRYLNGRCEKDRDIKVLIPSDDEIKKGVKPPALSSHDLLIINKELNKLNLGEPNRDKLIIPFLYKTTPKYHWKGLIIKAIKQLESRTLGVYDVAQDNEFRTTLESKFNTNELYTISTKGNKKLNYGKTLNDTKYIEEIDLSGVTDLVQLHPTTLTPEYVSVENTPKFSLRSLCEKLRSRFNGNQSLLPEMQRIVTETFAEELGDLINREVDSSAKKIFKNVTITPIQRDINGLDYETGIMQRNPQGLDRFDSLLPSQYLYRNLIFNNDDRKEDHLGMYVGTRDIPAYVKEKKPEFNKPIPKDLLRTWFTRSKYSPTGDTWINNYLNRKNNKYEYKDYNGGVDFYKNYESYDPILDGTIYPFKQVKLPISKGLQLAVQTHLYKLIEEGNEESDELDFTRTDGFATTVLLLIPDYARRTHVLSINTPIPEDLKTKFGLFFDSNDRLNPLRGKPIVPFITSELFNLTESTTVKRSGLLKEWSDSLNSQAKQVHPVTVFTHFISGTYRIKYKTYYSACDDNSYCDYNQYGSRQNKPSNGYRSGIETGYLVPVRKDGDNGIQYQVEITLPYTNRLIDTLNSYSHLHDYVLSGKVLNSTMAKGKNHPNPLVWKNDQIQRMDNEDLKNIGTNDIVAIGLNPINSGDWVTEFKNKGFITNEESTNIKLSYGNIYPGINSREDYDKVINSNVFKLTKSLITHLYENTHEYGPNETDRTKLVIPLRVYNDTITNNNLRYFEGQGPQLSTGMVRPYDGFNYLCYYRFYPRFDTNRFGFSDTTTPFKFNNNDYFVVVIPNDGGNSKSSVPTYTYREPITNMTRESTMAFLCNGSSYYDINGNDKYRNLYGGGIISNNHGEQGGYHGTLLNHKMAELVKQQNYFFEEFIKKNNRTKRTDNPTMLTSSYEYYQNGGQSFNITTLDDEIPTFIVKYLDPDSTLCQILHSWKKSSSSNDSDRLIELKEKIKATISSLKTLLSTTNTGFKLEGSDGYASVKLNIEENTTGDFELFTTKPNLIKSRTTDTGIFSNHRERDVDVLINTSNEITMYGKRVMQKSRYISDNEDLDIRLKITPLEDPKQTRASSGYKVDMKTDDQDLIRDVIEIPKEEVKNVIMSVYEREKLLREIDLKATERESEAQLLELSRDRFKVHDSFERSENARRAITREAHAGVDIAIGIQKGVTGILSLNASAALSGAEQAAHGAIDLVDAAQEYTNKERHRKARYAIGLREFDIKNEKMQRQHDVNRKNSMERLGQMSSRVQHPQMNSGLIYKQFNKSEGLNDVYITQYYPSGKLLRYIKEYYKEYGYEILVRDFTCIGIESITRHLRYINIFKNEHSNMRVKALIEARALNGIFVSDSEVFG